jgi:hypothetical protein
MTINLTPEQQKIIEDELKSGRFRTVEEVISRALSALRDAAHPSISHMDDGKRHEAVREMLRFVEQNHTPRGVSVKELIHEGHRL